MKLSNHIEALLFLAGEPMEIPRLAKILGKTREETDASVEELEQSLKDKGIRLMKNKDTITLGTAPESSGYCETLLKEELNRAVGKAGLETLAIVLYKGYLKNENGGVSRAEIDYIRGVNSTFTLRGLSIRGLVLRKINPKDKRSFVYSPSIQLMQYLGVTKKEELPKFDEFMKQTEEYLKDINADAGKKNESADTENI